MDERRLTFIVVPHGDLETKTFEISYRKLRVLAWGTLVMIGVIVFMVGVWWYILAQAARVPALETELKRFEQQRAKVDSLAQLLAEVEGQYERVRQLLGADAPADGRQPLLPELAKSSAGGPGAVTRPPLDAWPLGSVRGSETQAAIGDANHPGLHIAVAQATYVRAAGAGVVTAAEEDSIYGKFIRVDHGSGYESLYGHASQLLVAKGDRVKRQQVIALSGNTGKSTEPNLHFEIRLNGVPVDPKRYVRQP
ncbi:MAG TPA: peptidoglycan DD-metalloendopeptidase family protein [Longimicrobiales bacterium]|nr:peptidoglycan DD-metalloendopeptidase family protein [Longimicrobiales bacterium]